MRNAGIYALCALGVLLGVLVASAGGYGLYKSGAWTWGLFQAYQPTGHPMNLPIYLLFGLFGLAAMAAAATGVTAGLAVVVSALVTFQAAWNDQPASGPPPTSSAPPEKFATSEDQGPSP